MNGFGALSVLGLLVVIGLVFLVLRTKHLDIWLAPYLLHKMRSTWKQTQKLCKPTHVLFCMVDHFEPISAGSTREDQVRRMQSWKREYPALSFRHKDSNGRPPQHTWFYPGEEYHAEYVDDLVELCRQGLGEIELHLHHAHDTPETLRCKIKMAIENFSKHGALITQGDHPQKLYGFIHGNAALDNSRFDPSVCGVNNEITILRETGCYADFSMPTAPCISQPKIVNTIYYATDDPCKPKSHNTGQEIEAGQRSKGDLLIIPGPLAWNWHLRKWGILPRIDNSEVQSSHPPTGKRIQTWVRQHIHVRGRPEWVFVKVSCHGAEDRNHDVMLGQSANQMYADLEQAFRDSPGYRLHYVTARELYNIAKAAEAGHSGDPFEYRNFVVPPYRTHTQAQ